MNVRIVAVAMALLLWSPLSAADSPFVEAAQRLDGAWTGPNYELRVDSSRAQANIDQDRPFRWQRFLVKEVAGEKVIFTVGSELFEAVVQADTLTLTSTSFRGERVLQRELALLQELRR